jgi:hypothetical protein
MGWRRDSKPVLPTLKGPPRRLEALPSTLRCAGAGGIADDQLGRLSIDTDSQARLIGASPATIGPASSGSAIRVESLDTRALEVRGHPIEELA